VHPFVPKQEGGRGIPLKHLKNKNGLLREIYQKIYKTVVVNIVCGLKQFVEKKGEVAIFSYALPIKQRYKKRTE